MSLLAKLKCFGFGHDWQCLEPDRGIAGAHRCKCCGRNVAGIKWSAPPQMPACQPAKKVTDNLVVKVSVDCDGLDELERRVAALHAQWSAITVMREAHEHAGI